MEVIIYIIAGFVIYNLVKKSKKKAKGLSRSRVAAGVGGAATAAFLHQLMEDQQLDQDMIDQLEQLNLQQMQEFALQNELLDQMEMQRMMDESMDPYLNPGIDVNIDEHYHGHDHGIDHSFNDHNHHQF
ncbi:hypothetical protein KDJ21_007320 [Metabacillus litoralis]|uniref:hypothetical protein n=1 Tax=Metabacillus TaxID=2675233 RepID=UPI001B97A8BA|nr:hypothetical protein [Metabacillus litoralis]UHA61459.1 hypothetical protein KDJ21_007320 [Metabacillus litoralis]